MITVIENTNTASRVVRGLLYSDASALVGDKLQTTNCGLVECEYDSWAVSGMDGSGLMWFGQDNEWHAAQ